VTDTSHTETGHTDPADHGAATHEAGTEPGHAHPSDLQYVYVALVLAAITAAEVGIYYAKSLGALLVVILVVLSIIKFSIVVLWFMHLRFDSKLFRRLFVTGIGLALFVYGIVLTTFHVWTR
jgi:cytochrome c oxidase subunit 4